MVLLPWIRPGAAPLLLRVVASLALLVLVYQALTRPRAALSAACLPWRVVDALAFFVASVARSVGSRFVRRRAWNSLRLLAFGLTGSPHRMQDVGVSQRPDADFDRGEFRFEELDRTVEGAACRRRAKTLLAHWGRISGLPVERAWSVAPWRGAIEQIARDPLLVHAAYYRYPRAIDQIARHLGMDHEQLQADMEAQIAERSRRRSQGARRAEPQGTGGDAEAIAPTEARPDEAGADSPIPPDRHADPGEPAPRASRHPDPSSHPITDSS
jgi:hypothetical protein